MDIFHVEGMFYKWIW